MIGLLQDLARHLSTLVEPLSVPMVTVLSGTGAASGFVWRDGHVVTAEEALDADEGIVVALADDCRAPAVQVGRDASTDVARPPPIPLDVAAPRWRAGPRPRSRGRHRGVGRPGHPGPGLAIAARRPN